jgi:hypothetical protein
MESFSLKKLNEVKCKMQWCAEISHRFATLENLDDEVNIRQNINISAKETIGFYDLKKHKPWSEEGYS